MKKMMCITVVLLLFVALIPIHAQVNDTQADSDYQVIPDDAIRLRILANSDDEADQVLKRAIRDQISDQIASWVEEIDQIADARAVIESRLPELEETVAGVLAASGSTQSYQVDYGTAVSFPAKVYDTYLYPAGEYEAVLVTLGAGKGSNWWCVLFPPLCFLDFSFGTTVAEPEQEAEHNDLAEDVETEQPVKVKFFLLEWFR